jgi:hypothetical protein
MAKMTTSSKPQSAKSKVIRSGPLPMAKTPTKKPFASNPSGGKKRQAPSVVVS